MGYQGARVVGTPPEELNLHLLLVYQDGKTHLHRSSSREEERRPAASQRMTGTRAPLPYGLSHHCTSRADQPLKVYPGPASWRVNPGAPWTRSLAWPSETRRGA